MPSFDVVSEVDVHEVNNAVEQANREIGTRFDFKGVDANFSKVEGNEIRVCAEVDFQLEQMMEILRSKLVKRDVDTKSLMEGEISQAGKTANLSVKIQQGIESDVAKKLVKQIKEKKMKVQVSIQGEKLRVTGKKRDDLQNVMGLLRDVNPDLPLQFNNFRD